jgi:hypothetical protein
MVGEVNKIIYNMLVSGRGVYLPEVGSLYIERQAARKIADNKMLSPRNAVNFTSQEQAPSLVEEIVAIAKCEPSQAQDIYERWLSKTRTDNTITIEGIGKLVDKSFITDAEFSEILNPQGEKVLVLRKKRSHAWIYIISILCVIFTVAMWAFITWENLAPASITTAEDVVTLTEPVPAVEQGTAQQEVAAQPAIEPQPAEYRFYVVMGVFKEEANAQRAVKQVESKIENAMCVIRPFKEKHMVTIFGSDKRGDCMTYANAYRDIYPNLWIYENK